MLYFRFGYPLSEVRPAARLYGHTFCERLIGIPFAVLKIDRSTDNVIYIAPTNSKESLSASVAKKMSFQRSSQEIEGEFRQP